MKEENDILGDLSLLHIFFLTRMRNMRYKSYARA